MTTWLESYLAWCRQYLAIPDIWEIRIEQNDAILAERKTTATIDIQPYLLRATMYLPTTIQPDTEGYESVAHETFHVAMSDLDDAVDQAHNLLPDAAQATLKKFYHNAQEKLVTLIARRMAITYQQDEEDASLFLESRLGVPDG